MSSATLSNATIADAPLASTRWERNVPVYGFPVVNQFFLGLWSWFW